MPRTNQMATQDFRKSWNFKNPNNFNKTKYQDNRSHSHNSYYNNNRKPGITTIIITIVNVLVAVIILREEHQSIIRIIQLVVLNQESILLKMKAFKIDLAVKECSVDFVKEKAMKRLIAI
jgi:hypothetical protein